jgi:hypothetical protein
MEWGEAADERVATLKVAAPELFKVAAPRLLLPSKKVMVPVGTTPPASETGQG